MTAQARPLDLHDITGASEHVSMWGGRILGLCLAIEEEGAEKERRQSTRTQG